MWQRWNGTSHIFEKSDDNGSTWAPLPLDATILNQGIIPAARFGNPMIVPGGVQERGRTLPMGEWFGYAPVWAAAGGGVAIGNGGISGGYMLVGKTCRARIRVYMGSTSTYGSGAWSFSLPLTEGGSGGLPSGTCWVVDGTNGLGYPGIVVSAPFVGAGPASSVTAFVSNGAPVGNAPVLSAGAPFAWAARVPSYIYMEVVYEIA